MYNCGNGGIQFAIDTEGGFQSKLSNETVDRIVTFQKEFGALLEFD